MIRLRKHLTFANVIACTAPFVALGGVGYAAAEQPPVDAESAANDGCRAA